MKSLILIIIILTASLISSAQGGLSNNKPSGSSGFIENKGQIVDQNNYKNPAVLYLIPVQGMNVQIRRTGISYDVYDVKKHVKAGHYANTKDSLFNSSRPDLSDIYFDRIDINFNGINPDFEIITLDKIPGVRNYYTSGTPSEGVTNVSSYRTLICKNIYPDIDLELKSDDGTFKYNFIVNPGGDISSVRIKISGPVCDITDDGSVLMSTSLHQISERIPSAYYYLDGQKKETEFRFIRNSDNSFSFKSVNEIPPNSTVIIDPIPARIWGTYFGDIGQDAVWVSAIGQAGRLVYSGYTSSVSNIATAGSYQTVKGGYTDVFLTTSDANGYPVWSTYYGGEKWEAAHDICTASNGDIYIAGETSSHTNIASPGAFLETLIWETDAFLAKFSSDGQRIWSTYYGGNAIDFAQGCAVDNLGHVYLVGETDSDSGISTPGSFQPVYTGNPSNTTEGFIVQFSTSGTRNWATYYGGSYFDAARCVDCDNQNNLIVGGFTNSLNNISTPGAFQPALGNVVAMNLYDGFLVKFNTSGSRLWGTYYGGENGEYIQYLLADGNNNILISGISNSSTNMSSPGCFQPVCGGGNDCYLAKFSPSGSRLWGTYYGGSANESGGSIGLKYNDDIFITGGTPSADGISTPGSYQPAIRGINSTFLSKFSSTGTRIWGTYYGDSCSFASCSSSGDTIYATGVTSGRINNATPGSWKPAFSDSTDGIIVKFIDCNAPDTSASFTGPDTLCAPSSSVVFSIAPIPTATGYLWEVPPGAVITSGQNTTSITVDFNNSAVSGFIYVRGQNSCWYGERKIHRITIGQRLQPVINGSDTSCQGLEKTYSTDPGKTNYTWFIPPGGTVTGGGTATDDWVQILWNTVGMQPVKINYTQQNGCISNTSTKMVNVGGGDSVKVVISSSANNICAGSPVTFTATPTGSGTLTYDWKVNGISQGTNNNVFSYTPLNGDVVKCTLSSSVTTCVANNPATSNIITMIVDPLQPVSVSVTPSDNNVCQGATVTFTAATTPSSGIKHYQWRVNNIASGNDQPVLMYTPSNGDVVTCELNVSGLNCLTNNPDTSAAIIMTVNPYVNLAVSVSASANPVCAGIPVTFTATPPPGGTATYQWKVNNINQGTNQNTYTYTPLNNDIISCDLSVSGMACLQNNPASSNTLTMSVSVSPSVIFPSCFDTITTVNAKPIQLRGAIPYGGTYSGPGVNPTTGIFTPALAGTGTKAITYSYTNAGSCSSFKVKNIVVRPNPVFSCGNPFVDIRDNHSYKTVQIGTQCWMAQDLDYGTAIPQTVHQRDNCIAEKYAISVPPPFGGGQEGVYQWDELMDYSSTPGEKGLCPPSWHIPTEAEWQILFSNYTNIAFSASPLKYSGFSGFNAILSGMIPQNTILHFYDFASFYWTSTPHGSFKAWAHGFNDPDPSVSTYPASRQDAFSVRCVKD